MEKLRHGASRLSMDDLPMQQLSHGWSSRRTLGLIELKAEEFRSLKQGSMTVPEYRDKFAQLSRYAPNEVANDADK